MLDGSFDVVTAIRDLAVELDVLRRRVRLLEDVVAALSVPTSASSARLSSPKSVEPAAEAGVEPASAGSVGSAGRKGSKREKALGDDAVDAG